MLSVGDAWWESARHPGSMDQLSLPLALDDHGIDPVPWEFDLFDNRYFVVEPHRRLM